MVEETNRRAAQLLAKPGLKTSSSIKQWMDTTMNELKSFIALLLYMAIIWKTEVELHWTTNPMLEKSDVEKRFSLLMKCLHFVSNEVIAAGTGKAENLFNKIRLFFQALIEHFSAVYALSANVDVDESLMPWKG